MLHIHGKFGFNTILHNGNFGFGFMTHMCARPPVVGSLHPCAPRARHSYKSSPPGTALSLVTHVAYGCVVDASYAHGPWASRSRQQTFTDTLTHSQRFHCLGMYR